MSAALERQVLAQVLNTYAAENNLPVSWPNRVFEKPATGLWVQFTVIDMLGRQMEFGTPNNAHRVVGMMVLQVFAPADSGDAEVLGLANALGFLYRQKILNFPDSPPSGLVRTRDPTVRTIGRSGKYFQVNVTVPFHRDEYPT